LAAAGWDYHWRKQYWQRISVKGSTTSPNKISILEKIGIHPFNYSEADRISGPIEDFKAAQSHY
jgi:hypothetical protein